ncbi:MAG: NAD-dependent deacylase [Chloroflexi bacterium]|nr:NAD-dependent deacylase [Chloroflexota bacterium]
MRETLQIPESLVRLLRAAHTVVAFTGAGISAESGVPTFRDAQTGLWARYDPRDLATPQAFMRNPKLVWDWYEWRRSLVEQAQPNPGHRALAVMEGLVPEMAVVTQNVDGLHQRAGSQRVIELHGRLGRYRCFDCGRPVRREEAAPPGPEGVPRCPHCGGLIRPDVVWFNEPLPQDALEQASAWMRKADVVLIVGTSAQVWPAAGLPLEAKRAGAVLVEVNPQPSQLAPVVDFALRGPAGQWLPALVTATWPEAASAFA